MMLEKCSYGKSFSTPVIVSATRRSWDIKIPLSVGPRSEKFNIVSNDHGRTQKFDFCGSLRQTNFTDHHTPDAIKGFSDSVLVCKIHDYYCTIRKLFEHFHSFSSGLLTLMKRNYFKMLSNVFSTTYTYSNCIVYWLFYC